jgi:hypothetical protein
MATDIIETEARPELMCDPLRVDQVIQSRHKYVLASPRLVSLEHDGEVFQLVLPDYCPACEFLVTSATGEWLFLIVRWPPRHDGESFGGAVVVARRQGDGAYVTELWHETHGAFMVRSSLGAVA